MEQHKRVLVVDDDPQVRQLLETVLRARSLQVDLAADGAEALALIAEHPYSVILLDLVMPNVDGFAVLQSLAANTSVMPVVLVITGGDRRLIDRLDAQNIHGIIRKPFDAEDLAGLVQACAEVRERSSYGAMAIATMIAGSPFLALLNRLTS